MALFEDMFKGNAIMTMAVGVGAVILAPVVVPALSQIVRPAAKAAIKGGYVLYQRGREQVAELGEMTEDIVAEARAELEEEGNGAALRARNETVNGEGAEGTEEEESPGNGQSRRRGRAATRRRRR